jgi:hypothetical protein
MSRDLDSALTARERAAVDDWLASNKQFHTMRDHPSHSIPMLGGMWGFRPSLNRNLSRLLHYKIYNRTLIKTFSGIYDQRFLRIHVWPVAKLSAVAHDSFHCRKRFGHISRPFPTQRPSAYEPNCIVGCSRTCSGHEKLPFKECPIECRPKELPEWLYC